MTTEWIKISERKPINSDLPVVFGSRLEGGSWTQIFCGNLLMTDKSWTHWFPMNKIPDAPKEPTQEELDKKAFTKWFNSEERADGMAGWIENLESGFAAGTAFERSAIRHLIQRHRNGELPGPEVIRMISGRVKL